MTQHFSPDEVVARIPTSALRDICARDPHLKDLSAVFAASLRVSGGNKENEAATLANRPPRLAKAVAKGKSESEKKLSGREARKRIVAEIERLAVRDLCHHHVPMARLLAAVAELGIDHMAMGNSASSRKVAAKRLSEHIASLSPSIRSGLVSFLENEASVELVDELVVALIPDDDGSITERSAKAKKVEAVVRALEHEAMVAFFESFSEQLLHHICLVMKNEDSQGETSSRSVLATSIIHDQHVSQLVKALNKKKNKQNKQKLSRKKPELIEGVTYDDVFQWYNLSELQEFARVNSLKVSGKKKEIIHRILDFLSNGAPAASRKAPRRGAPSASGKKSSASSNARVTKRAKASSPVFNERIQALLERVLPHCKIANKPLTDAQIDQSEAELKKTKGEGVRLPDALRQLYATCNGFCVQGDWTWGFCVFPLIYEDGSGPVDNQVITAGGDPEVIQAWVSKALEEGHKAEHSVTHPSWLTLAGRSEYDSYFINIDPASDDFGSIRGCTNNCTDEWDHCDDLETLLEQAATYVERCERAKAKFLAEEPELADDEDALKDAVNDEICFGEESDDDDQDDQDDKAEQDDAVSGDDHDDEEADE